MNRRSVLASSTIIATFLGFLVWLYLAGIVGFAAIAVILVAGIVFIGVTHYFYTRLWLDDENDDQPDA